MKLKTGYKKPIDSDNYALLAGGGLKNLTGLTDIHEVSLNSYTAITRTDTNNGIDLTTPKSASGLWVADISGITSVYDGLTIKGRLLQTGHSYTNLLSIDGGVSFYPMLYRNNAILTTHMALYAEVILTYRSGNYVTSNGTSGRVQTSVKSGEKNAVFALNTKYTGCWTLLYTYYTYTNTTYTAIIEGYCSTAAATKAKVVTCTNFGNLVTGTWLKVRFTVSNTNTAPTLNVNSTGAKSILINGEAANYTSLVAGTYLCYYDGTYWDIRVDHGARFNNIVSGSISGIGNSMTWLANNSRTPVLHWDDNALWLGITQDSNVHLPIIVYDNATNSLPDCVLLYLLYSLQTGLVGIGTYSPAYNLDVVGTIHCTTGGYSDSDIRFKNVLEDIKLTAEDIANLPIFKYTWKNKVDDILHAGSSAQAVEKILPELVTDTGTKSLDYATLGTIGSVIACRRIIELEDKVKELEEKINGLQNCN